MKKRRILAALCLMILCCAWAATAAAATYGTVFGGWLRLRANPSYSAAIITSYPNGSVVTVLSRSNGWCRVLTSDYRYGYMDQRFLYISGHVPTPDPDPSPYHRTWTTVNRTAYVTSQNGKGVRMRSAPVVNNYNVLGLYPVGRTLYEMRRSNDGWSYIRIDGRYGYMMSQFITGDGSPVDPGSITSVKINITKPMDGDTLKLTVKPHGAHYSVIWYNSDFKLLGTQSTYKVKTSDVGTRILIRVTGSDGTVIEGSTDKVQPALKKIDIEETEKPSPTETPKPTDTPAPTDTPKPTDTPAPEETPKPTDTPAPTDTPKPTDTPAPTDTPKPTDTPAPTDTPKPTDTPAPTDTPKPTDPPAPEDTPASEETGEP